MGFNRRTTARSRSAQAVVLTTIFAAVSASAQGWSVNVPEGAQVYRDLEYVEDGHERQRLDLYIPDKADAPVPVIVWIHGGAWMEGSKDDSGQALGFVARGYAVSSIGYRLSQHAKFPAQIEDCKAAIRWLRANAEAYHLDSEHIGVWGESAGGHLAALVGTTGDVKELEGSGGNAKESSRVQAVVDFFGPTDLLQLAGQARPDSMLNHDSPDSPGSRLIGGAIQENPEKAQRANPIHYLAKDAPPFFIAHGDRDPVVPCQQSELLRDALKRVGVEVVFTKIPGASHGGPEFNSLEMQASIEAFFDEHLKGHSDGGRP